MDIRISNADPRPIYAQVREQIKEAILTGQVAEGALLPSIRALAKDLRISVITTKRAYDELERDGYVHTVPGKGVFVAPKDAEMVREDCLRRIEGHMEEILHLAQMSGITTEELKAMLETLAE